MKPDYYETLGVNKGATAADIKSAYRKKALEWHPDRNKSPEAEEHFKQINEAYEILSNSEKRTAYDQFGHAAFEGAQAGPGGPTHSYRQGPRTYTYYSGSGSPFGQADFSFGGFSNPFDIFEQFFGGAFTGNRQSVPTYRVSLSFREAAQGVEKEVTLPGGSKKKIKIPAGVDDGQRLRFQNFYLYIDVSPDSVFRRDGQDLFVEKELSLSQAILGGETEVPTLNEALKIKIRPGTQGDTLIRLRGKGLPDPQGRGVGDLYIRLKVKIPTRLTRAQKKAILSF